MSDTNEEKKPNPDKFMSEGMELLNPQDRPEGYNSETGQIDAAPVVDKKRGGVKVHIHRGK